MKNLFNKIIKNISNILFVVLLGFLLFTRGPTWWAYFSNQGQRVPSFKALDFKGNPVEVNITEPVLLVFWATWCGPCEIELSRLKKMVEEKKLNPERVFLISGNEDIPLVQETIQKNGYPFKAYFDVFSEMGVHFKVQGTPTLVLIDRETESAPLVVEWQTMGLSPTLEFRLGNLK